MSAVAMRVSRGFLGRRGAALVLERNLLVYRRLWLIIFSGFFEPLFYLFAARVGLGELVGDVRDGSGELVSYAAFVGPALLASAAMNGAVYESTMNIYFKLKFAKTYDAMLATPLKPFDIALGEIVWSLMRGAIYATGFLIIVWAMGLTASPWAVLAFPSALLIGFAFAAVGLAATTYMRSWQDFEIVNLVILILFLFSATFFPLSVYPEHIQTVAKLSPLYHGVTLIRSLMLGTPHAGLLWHVLVLAIMGAAGLTVAKRRLATLLLR